MIPVKIKRETGAHIPEYQTAGSAGVDLHAYIEKNISLEPGETVLVPTGLYIQIPEGYEAQIRPRSGLAIKNGITMLNSPGTIDSDYRGEIKIIMTNLGSEAFIVTKDMRIGQMVFKKVYKAHFIEVDDLCETERNEGGFGHSGV